VTAPEQVDPILVLVLAVVLVAAVVRVGHPDARRRRAHRRRLRTARRHEAARLATAQRRPTCPCGCNRAPGQHTPSHMLRQHTPKES
jgi:hypothetical protein